MTEQNDLEQKIALFEKIQIWVNKFTATEFFKKTSRPLFFNGNFKPMLIYAGNSGRLYNGGGYGHWSMIFINEELNLEYREGYRQFASDLFFKIDNETVNQLELAYLKKLYKFIR